MPQHEALLAIMLSNQQVYFEEFSPLGNPFDSRLAKSEARLLRLFVLSAIVNLSSENAFRHLEGGEIRKHVREIGFGDNLIAKVLSDLCELRFIHTSQHPDLRIQFCCVSRLGVVRTFIANFVFIENVMADTFISDEKVWLEPKGFTKEIYSERNNISKLKLRKERAPAFYAYMSELYNSLYEESIRRGLPRNSARIRSGTCRPSLTVTSSGLWPRRNGTTGRAIVQRQRRDNQLPATTELQ